MISFRKRLWKEEARSGSGSPHWAQQKPVLEIERRSLPMCPTGRPNTIPEREKPGYGKSGSVEHTIPSEA